MLPFFLFSFYASTEYNRQGRDSFNMEMTFTNSYSARRQVLVVDDEFVNRQLLGMIISEDYDVLYAENGRQAMDVIREKYQTLSLVLLDLLMPEMDGFEVIEQMRADEELKRIPVIVLTSEKDAEVRTLKLGAADFIKKPYDMPEVILARIWRTIELSEGRNIIQAAEKDDLTGLYTGNFFFEYAQKMERYHEDWEMDAIALNIEHFHLVNELYGREFGDRVLRLVARRISKFLGTTEGIACRREADMFMIYCRHQDDYDSILETIQSGLVGVSKTVRIRLRMGVYPQADRKLSMERQFDRAKIACNKLRDNFSKSLLIYDSALHHKEIYSESLVNGISKAIEQRQLMAYFQPKYNIAGDTPVLSSAEALVRWKHPEYGMVSPGDFIPLFESNGLIAMVDNFVWREAGRQIRQWKEEYGVTVPVSVNLSRIDMYDPDLEKKFLDIIQENGLTTHDMLLEVTESAYTEDTDNIIEKVQRLRELGFRIEMDDFGSGYSSLNMLFSLPIDVLKLDMKFIQGVNKSNDGMRLIKLIMDIAEYLNVPVVAEGVETREQCLMLKDVGCHIIQGYYFSRPQSPEEFVDNFKGGKQL